MHLLGQPNAFLAPVGARLRAAAKGDDVAALLALLEGEGGRAKANPRITRTLCQQNDEGAALSRFGTTRVYTLRDRGRVPLY